MLVSRIVVCLSLLVFLTRAKELEGKPFVKLQKYQKMDEATIDTVVYIDETLPADEVTILPGLKDALLEIKKIDASFEQKASVHPATIKGKENIKRIIFAPTGRLDSDVADSRSIYEAARDALKMGHKAGAKNILLLIGKMPNAPKTPEDLKQEPWAEPKYMQLQALLGALYALYVPLEVRECCKDRVSKYEKLYVQMAFSDHEETLDWAIQYAKAIEEGRWVARDICGSDSERMSTEKIVEYLEGDTDLKPLITLVAPVSEAEYPLMAAVDRGNQGIKRHEGRVVKMAFGNNETATKVLSLVGKGITFDTGGYDLKVSGAMVGMHRDKCGAAAIVGFLKTAQALQKAKIALPTDLFITAKLAFVRNALSARAYTIDEIMKSRAGKRIRIGNTDAEGRMVMTDLIAEAKEEALGPFEKKDVQIITAATLTGHVVRCYKWITGALENGPSKEAGFLKALRLSGDQISDMLEISALRKEDYDFNLTPLETEDYLQCNNAGSVSTPRGHQAPAAFLIQASGLDAYGLDSKKRIKFAHLDVAGSAGQIDTVPTAAPMTMLANHYLIKPVK